MIMLKMFSDESRDAVWGFQPREWGGVEEPPSRAQVLQTAARNMMSTRCEERACRRVSCVMSPMPPGCAASVVWRCKARNTLGAVGRRSRS